MKRILILSVVLALVLSLVLPSVAMAKPPGKEFYAQGEMYQITIGDVKQLGNGLWLVKNREIFGKFVNGDLEGLPFTITYDGIFELETQAGDFHGKLNAGRNKYQIKGTVEPYQFLEWYDKANFIPILSLDISGRWIGNEAKGTFNAFVKFIPTPEGHVGYIFEDSCFTMTGMYNKKK
ncbi:MAG: hypothetical protein JXA46_10650 [Dehalococcoidales bacterium]|nr:hypothetical protein [Dehalococcoidales bacterium]